MGYWKSIFPSDRERTGRRLQADRRRLLSSSNADRISTGHDAKEVTKVALRLKYQVEQVISCELEESTITDPNSRVITSEVVQTAKQAGGDELQTCVLFCLLVCLRWFKIQASQELWDSDLHERRALTCEVIAKRIIEAEENQDAQLMATLLKRYSVFIDGEETMPANVIERAIDLHALRVIGSSGYQKCIRYLWNGRYYFDFWNAFNSTLYTILAVSFFLRVAALTHSSSVDDEQRRWLNELSYNFLAFAGPMFWMRMVLYLDSFRFFGAMLVVLRVMMKESLIFFALLFVVLVGFFQAFIGMAQVDTDQPVTKTIVQGMANSIMQSPEFGAFEDFAYPFGIILYYFAYEDISGNAIDEYMAIFAQKTMQYIRAPDENVFIPPFNLLEIIFLILPFEWWLPRQHYAKLNEFVMGILYSPLLLVTAFLEVREARRIRWNRRRGEDDDDDVQEWEHAAEEVGFEVDDVWDQAVQNTAPVVTKDPCSLEIIHLREQIRELTESVRFLSEKSTNGTFCEETRSTIVERE
ncbi:putative potassium ion channel Yvc1 [Aspergillus tanneri]|uniref:YVC1 N-terminal linker helical domain-containing protein n=1 Tax=Aspergillus tanneri TaxID=1220188 RepID=A0A5M9MM05_9EURO|nr:uncharacterized protein ATNIH1004_007885 [Aspergillus tanneri]KAA8646454.1 hypothetical protein ATNIH1004_007885 [Aspergillus tanneri]